MNTLIIVLTVIVAVLLICIVLVQKSKGGGLSSQFGNASSLMGVRQTNSFLEKTTWTLAALILVLSVCTAYTIPSGARQVRANQETSKQQSAAPAPAKNFSTGAEKAAETPAAPAQQQGN